MCLKVKKTDGNPLKQNTTHRDFFSGSDHVVPMAVDRQPNRTTHTPIMAAATANPLGQLSVPSMELLSEKRSAVWKKRSALERQLKEFVGKEHELHQHGRYYDDYDDQQQQQRTLLEKNAPQQSLPQEQSVTLPSEGPYAIELEWMDRFGNPTYYTGPVNMDCVPHGRHGKLIYIDADNFGSHDGHLTTTDTKNNNENYNHNHNHNDDDDDEYDNAENDFNHPNKASRMDNERKQRRRRRCRDIRKQRQSTTAPISVTTTMTITEHVYEGPLHEGLKTGQGVETYSSGDCYEGAFWRDRRHGQGRMTFADGRHYDGGWKRDQIEGHGVFRWPDGMWYDGDCHKGKKHGEGVQVWPSGKSYRGEFRQGQAHGQGTLTLPDGRKYRGQFRNGRPHGFERTQTTEQSQQLDTIPSSSTLTVKARIFSGECVLPDGSRYTGSWKNGKYHGEGTYAWPTGKVYHGKFRRGDKHGKGTFSWPNGKVYKGEYKNGKKSGFGVCWWPDGSIYRGGWKNNVRHGTGVHTHRDGTVLHCGHWDHDEPVLNQDTGESTKEIGLPVAIILG